MPAFGPRCASMKPHVSIVIPVRHDAEALARVKEQLEVPESSLGIDVGIAREYGNRTGFPGNLLTWEGREHLKPA